jgi:Flp pilus assembly protein TadD
MMKEQKSISSILLSIILLLFVVQIATASPAAALQEQYDEAEIAEIRAATQYVPAERIEKLKAFIAAHPDSKLKAVAQELIVSGRAAWGDEKLRAGDTTGGLEQFRLAIGDVPENMTDKLYIGVVSKIPYNLFLLGQRAGAVEVARLIEARVKDNPKRLLMLADFYTRMEDAKESARVSEMAVRLAPDMAEAHLALALAHHISLQLEQAANEYARALELDPKLQTARRSLADLRRAQGRTDDALALYREQLANNPADKMARSGLVLSLLEAGKKDDAEREMEAALKEEPNNLQLLAGAAYWYAAHSDNARALELAQRAVEIEPRFTWAQIALARALIADGRPLAAEQALRFAHRYGHFPTLDYELANALAAAGLYTEAATELARSFSIRGGQLETQLAGRNPARNASFIELLAPERRASIFQATAADTEENARRLRALLAFTLALGEAGKRETVNEREALSAAQDFTTGTDPMRAFRQLYVADRLTRAGLFSQAVLDFAEAASTGVDAAVNVPAASIATLADDLYGVRLQAISNGTAPAAPEIERSVRASILQGRSEEIAGWVLYHQDKMTEAVARLRKATGLLPENSVWWRSAQWRLGAALEASGEEQEALASYIRSYDKSAPDAGHRAIIEKLYRKLNGSLEGLDAKLGAASSASATASNEVRTPAQLETKSPAPPEPSATETAKNEPATNTDAASTPQSTDALPATETGGQQTNTGRPRKQIPEPEGQSPAQTPASEQPTAAGSGNTTESGGEAANQSAPSATPEPTPAARSRSTGKQSDAACSFSIDVDTITIKNNGGTGHITVTLSGTDKITPTTSDWPDITVFAQSLKEYGTFPFLVTSISKRTGRYTVTFTTPCGSKDVTVIVK